MSFCSQCGSPRGTGTYCSGCGASTQSSDSSRPVPQMVPQIVMNPVPVMGMRPIESKKTLAGLMGIFFGGFGVHKFILGYTTEGILMIVITLFTCGIGAILGLVEGIIYLTKSDDEFVQTYQLNKRGWF